MKSCQTVKENEQTYTDNVPSVQSDTGHQEVETCNQLDDLPIFWKIIKYN